MTVSLLLSEVRAQLTRGKMPADKAWVDVMDAKLSSPQQLVLSEAKAALGIDELSTFSCGKNKDGQRVIVSPKLVKGDSVPCIRWGKNTYEIPEGYIKGFEVIDDSVVVDVNGFYLNVSFIDLRDMADRDMNPIQKKLRSKETKQDKAKLCNDLTNRQLNDLLRATGSGFTKLSELAEGEHTIVAYEASNGKFGTQYKLTTYKGLVVDGNTAIKQVCQSWDDLGVVVDDLHPATLVVNGHRQTKTGNTMVLIELYSHADMELEPFDFDGGDTESSPAQEEEDLAYLF